MPLILPNRIVQEGLDTAEPGAGPEPAHPSRPFLARFLSTSFYQPVGSNIAPGEARGYYLDMRIKALHPRWDEEWNPVPGAIPWVAVAQRGLGGFERYLEGEGEVWLGAARELADRLVAAMRPDGGLEHHFEFPHTFKLRPPWLSGMAQGEAASLLVRLYAETGEERYAEAAGRAVQPLSVPTDRGGAMVLLDGQPFPEEYPTPTPSLVLNGGIFGLWGVYDVGMALGDGEWARQARDSIDALARNVGRWDTGSWSRYDLYPHRMPNVASPAYHRLHIDQLRAMNTIAPRPGFVEAADRFEGYAESRANVARAFARKVLFRVAVPRNERLARFVGGP